jgi:hypothetical protein
MADAERLPEGKPYRLPAPFEMMTVQYPYHWAQPNRVHVYDTQKMEGTVYGPEWAEALAVGILTAKLGAGKWVTD